MANKKRTLNLTRMTIQFTRLGEERIKMRRLITWGTILALLAVANVSSYGQTTPAATAPDSTEVVKKVMPALVLILAGEGSGRLSSTGSGLIVRSDGVLLTAYHLVKNAREVQVRLMSGEIYDRVELIGFDERRDIAALRISAVGLPELPVTPLQEIQVGQQVYAFSNPRTLQGTASEGILSANRMSDEVRGAGTGYRLLQFTAPVSPGSSGGILVDAQGRALGIITRSAKGQNLNFAVPLQSVLGLAEGTEKIILGQGSSLRLPAQSRTPSSAVVARTDPAEILRSARTFYITSRTMFFTPEVLENELRKRSEIQAWKLTVVNDLRVADLKIEVDRPLFTYDFTFSVVHQASSVVVASGKVTAFEGNVAAPPIATEFIKQVKKMRPVPESKDKTANP